MAAASGLSPGMALWKVGQRSFVVEHLVSQAERWIVHTEPREEATAGRRIAGGRCPAHALDGFRHQPLSLISDLVRLSERETAIVAG